MVANKVQARAPRSYTVIDPAAYRSVKLKKRGLRLGEMEKDTFIAHGASLLLKERFDSDKITVPVCEKSGLMGYYDPRKGGSTISTIYGENAEMSNIEISYAFQAAA